MSIYPSGKVRLQQNKIKTHSFTPLLLYLAPFPLRTPFALANILTPLPLFQRSTLGTFLVDLEDAHRWVVERRQHQKRARFVLTCIPVKDCASGGLFGGVALCEAWTCKDCCAQQKYSNVWHVLKLMKLCACSRIPPKTITHCKNFVVLY